MGGLASLARMKRSDIRNRMSLFIRGSRLKIAVILLFSTLFWYTLYRIFLQGFSFINKYQYFSHDLVAALLYLFFFSLALMLVFSNAVILYTAFFRERETAFLLTKPIATDTLFVYKFIESLFFSSWAFLFLAAPLIVAYGVSYGFPAPFYAIAAVYFAVFITITAAVGAVLAFFFAIFFPRSRKGMILFIVVVIAIMLLLILSRFFAMRGIGIFDYRMVKEVFDAIGFCKNPLLPSYWVTRGLLASGSEDYATAGFYFLVMLANALVLFWTLYLLSGRILRAGWHRVSGLVKNKQYPLRGMADRVARVVLFAFPSMIRQFVAKDLKIFSRDVAQWSQSLIFFGLLALYFANIRTFAYEERDDVWKNMIAQLNLISTSLTLLTFISRFVFPQVSIEGRRFWLIGMIPIDRRNIIMGKFLLSLCSSLVIGISLIILSSIMLKTPFELALLHVVTMVGICAGLSGLASGLGALYPNFSEDNPSKIISGFGGTLNLVLSLCFVLVVIAAQAIPCYYYFSMKAFSVDLFHNFTLIALLVIMVISGIATLIPLTLGIKALRRLEI